MLKEKIKAFVKAHRDEIVRDLMELVKIPSVSTDKIECERMLAFVKELYEKRGFSTEIGDEYLLTSYGKGEDRIGLFAHGDVVDGGEGWLLTSPFEPRIYEGTIVGRGAWDDKSAVVLSLYTLLALKELDLPIKKEIICYTGANEENGMSDIINYKKSNTPPSFSLVLDAGFPLYYGDKGKAWVRVVSRRKFKDVTAFFGGKMINIILGYAQARIKYTAELYSSICQTDRVKIARDGDEIVIKATGNSTHGANPEGSINAAWLIADALKGCPDLDLGDREILSDLEKILRTPYGEGAGIENHDPVFGRLTMTNGIVELTDGVLAFTLDLRFGKEAKMAEMLKKLEKALDEMGFELEILSADDAYACDPSEKHVQTCIDAYKRYTGKDDARLYINAGSTYARHIGNACETGTTYGGTHLDLPRGHGHAHEPDEHISIDGLLNALEIIIYMVSELCK